MRVVRSLVLPYQADELRQSLLEGGITVRLLSVSHRTEQYTRRV
jgi:hypothetical protein